MGIMVAAAASHRLTLAVADGAHLTGQAGSGVRIPGLVPAATSAILPAPAG